MRGGAGAGAGAAASSISVATAVSRLPEGSCASAIAALSRSGSSPGSSVVAHSRPSRTGTFSTSPAFAATVLSSAELGTNCAPQLPQKCSSGETRAPHELHSVICKGEYQSFPLNAALPEKILWQAIILRCG